MSQRDFMTAISRLSFHASTLGSRGGQYVALAQLNQLVDHFDALVTYPSADSFSPFVSPTLDDGLPFFGPVDVAEPAPALSPKCAQPLRRTRKHTGFYFDKPHTLDDPPPVPSRHDTYRTDRPQRSIYPAVNPREGFNAQRDSNRSSAHPSEHQKNAV